MVPAPGSQRQSQQMVPKKPSSSSSSPPEILRGRLLRDRQEQIPISPCPIPTGVWVLSLPGQLCLVPGECSTPGCEHLGQRVPSLPFLPGALSLHLPVLAVHCWSPCPAAQCPQRSQTESAMEMYPNSSQEVPPQSILARAPPGCALGNHCTATAWPEAEG